MSLQLEPDVNIVSKSGFRTYGGSLDYFEQLEHLIYKRINPTFFQLEVPQHQNSWLTSPIPIPQKQFTKKCVGRK